MNSNVVVKFPVFFKVSECAKNMFWKGIFMNLAWNRPPSFVTLQNSSDECETQVVYFHPDNGFRYTIPTSAACEQVYAELVDLFQTKVMLYCVDDYPVTDQQYQSFLAATQWNHLKKNFLKDFLITSHVADSTRLEPLEMRRLQLRRQNLQIYLKYVDTKQIQIQSGQIVYLKK